jgi:hypothetical protein
MRGIYFVTPKIGIPGHPPKKGRGFRIKESSQGVTGYRGPTTLGQHRGHELAAWVAAMIKHILAAIGLLAITYPAQKCPPSAFPYHLGCGGPRSSGECHILRADDETIRKHGWTPEIVLRHEIGHCNGWRGHHPGARRP